MLPLRSIDFITLTGVYKKLENPYTANDTYTPEIRRFINDIQCSICMDIYEKPLVTRRCEHGLCASCYLQLKNKKNCPLCNKNLPKKPEHGLNSISRITTNLLDGIVKKCVVKLEEQTKDSIDKSAAQNSCMELILKEYTLSNTASSDDSDASDDSDDSDDSHNSNISAINLFEDSI